MTLSEFYLIITYVMAGVFGLCIGSFLNVVIYRVPLGMSVSHPASHCPNCKTPIKWYDNIPVISYTLLGAKCRSCKVHIPFRYTAVEISNALLWLFSVKVFYPTGLARVMISAIVCSVLLCVFFIDIEHLLIPDRFQVILGVLALTVTVLDTVSDHTAWIPHVIGGVAGFAVTYLLGKLCTRMAGEEALGGGDIKLCGVMGLFLGWQGLILAMLIASLGGCAVIFGSKLAGKAEKRQYPFAPFLAAGFAAAMFFGERIISAYISLFI